MIISKFLYLFVYLYFLASNIIYYTHFNLIQKMKKLLTFLILLALALPQALAGEKTITISRNEGNISEGTGVYYAEKDGIVFQFSGGLDNENYLLCMQQKQVIIRSYTYRIRKIVFHCVDNTVEGDDTFFWGPTTLSIVANQSQGGSVIGTYNADAGSYIGTWTGTLPVNTQLTFESKARPVRFASIDVTYEKLDGDIFDLVTNNSQIVEGKSYIIVSQYKDKVMSFKKLEDNTHQSADIVEWPLGDNNKTKVKVDGEAKIFKMTSVKDSTIGSNTRKVAWFYDLNSYIREGSGTNVGDLITNSSASDYGRAIMYISATEYNYLCWFKNGSGSSSKTIRYDYDNKEFKILSISDSEQRVWLYKQAESYSVSTICSPPEGGNIVLGNGVVDGTSQQYETVHFTVSANSGFHFNTVTITDADNNVIEYDVDENGNYTFEMPASSVTITANFVPNLYLLGTANGGIWTSNGEWVPYGPMFKFSPEIGYYIDVYFTGTGNFGDNTGSAYGYFSLATRYATDNNWNYLNGHRLVSRAYDYESEDIVDGQTKTLYTDADNNRGSSFCIPAGLYRLVVNPNRTQISVTKTNPTLTLDPMGGETAATAVQVQQNQEVTLQGSLYNQIRTINANIDTPPGVADVSENAEPAANFKYKIVKNNTAETPVASTTTATTTLTEVNAGETVTELRGYNYLGWIHADNTAYYKVINTPLKWIEEEGTEGHKYTVADDLIIIHKIDRPGQRLLWAKDMSTYVTDPYNHPTNKYATFKTVDQTDYLDETLHVQTQGWGGWDQSNWVMLRFPENEDMSQYNINNFILAGTLVGTYVDDVNFCINVERMETGGLENYVPNTFCPANFLDYNLNLNNTEGGAVSPSGKKFFFMNPKVQEVADVTLAVWDATNSRFVMPSGTGVNQAGITGFFTVNCLYNKDGDVISSLVDKNMYKFRGVLNVAPGGSNASKDAPTSPDATKMVMPFDLNDQSVATAISDVMGNKTVSSVKYYNITGIESDKPFNGVNIVVTRYTDGSFSTTKVLR